MEKPRQGKKAVDLESVKLRAELTSWLRGVAKKEGRYFYRIVEDLIADGLKGSRPWEEKE